MNRKDAETTASPALFDWEYAAAPLRTIHDEPTLFRLEEIPIRPTKDSGSTT